jgi:acyl dehydratase
MDSGSGQLYFDDFKLGDRFGSPGHTLGEAHFLLFAGLTGDNHPMLLGDTVHSEFEVAGLERKGDRGVLRLRVTLVNQRGEEVIEGHHVYLLRCR